MQKYKFTGFNSSTWRTMRGSPSIGETTSVVTSFTVTGETVQATQGDKNVKRKQYYKERDATRVYLF